MPHLQRKGFDRPDQVRSFPHGKIDFIQMGEVAVARFVFQPGWRWSKDVAPIAGTMSCQHRHLGYTISGRLHVRTDDGVEMLILPGDAYEIPPGHDAWVHGDEPWSAVEFAAGLTYGVSPEDLGERTLQTILFSDIVDSTTKLAQLGDRAWAEVMHEHDARVRTALDQVRGREIATLGDGFLALFDGPAKAVRAAMLMQRNVEDLRLKLRIGIHTGEVEVVGGQARGVAVHTAARVAALAVSDEVLVSGTTHGLLDGSNYHFEHHGDHELRGLPGRRSVYVLKV